LIDAEKSYKNRINKFKKLEARQAKVINIISNLRLVVFLCGTLVGIMLYLTHNYILLASDIVVFMVLFVYLVVNHGKQIKRKEYTSILIQINQDSEKRINGEWHEFIDSGDEFVDLEHRYVHDLDIFGKGSLFQWINTTKTFLGRRYFSDLLTKVPDSTDDIRQRQEAIKELSKRLTWRQRLQAEALAVSEKIQDPEELFNWSGIKNGFYRNSWLIAFARILPCITVILILVAIYSQVLTYHLPVLFLILQFIVLRIGGKARREQFALAESYGNDVGIYYKSIKLLEKHSFDSEYIAKIKKSMSSKDNKNKKNLIPAYKQMDRLNKIIDLISSRHSAFFEVFNILTLWDYQCTIFLERWKEQSGECIRPWIESIAKIEALSSLAVIGFQCSEWIVPEIVDDKKLVFEAEQIGHPLLGKNRVCNDIEISKPLKTLLITGSNMSGKSTFLRTTGINLVLAYAGAPVCAKRFYVSIMEIYTCMRVSDNLEKNISSFYAELIRIKSIVQEAKSGKNIFFLLDEIFKGTNSRDRHIGAKVLINELCDLNCIGLVSTHDLELSELENIDQRIKNFHFEEYYKNDKIYFDYKLRQGVSKTRNAVFLMKLAGIEINE